MAEHDDAQEKTEKATPKRLEESRRKGEVPRSRDLSAAAVTIAVGAALYLLGGYMSGQMYELVHSGLSLSREQAMDPALLVPTFAGAVADGLEACAPVLGIALLAAFLAPLTLGGWNFSSEALAPKLERLNPLSGFKRMFALRSLVELGKALAKFGVVAGIAVLVLWNDASELMALGRESTAAAIGHAVKMSGQGLLAVSAGLLLIAAVDVPLQLWQFAQKMRMSRQEVREEMKETEGSPEIKGRIRQVQQEMARRRMMQEVPNADVVVTNPTHFAVALRYDDKRMRAPVVVAKGVDLVAARIREIATEHAVPVFEAPPLARVLYRNVEIGGEIPASLYVAVAQVLTYVFQLRTLSRSGGPMPPRPTVDVTE